MFLHDFKIPDKCPLSRVGKKFGLGKNNEIRFFLLINIFLIIDLFLFSLIHINLMLGNVIMFVCQACRFSLCCGNDLA